MEEQTIWLSDSDICDRCNGLLGYFGICIDCGWDGIEDSEWEEWDEEFGHDLYYDEFCEIG